MIDPSSTNRNTYCKTLLEALSCNIWQSENEKERTFHLKAARELCRQLPFHDSVEDEEILTLRKFLIRLGVAENGAVDVSVLCQYLL
jgi:hypothetical protein